MEVVRNRCFALVHRRLERKVVQHAALKREQAWILLDVEEDGTLLLEEPEAVHDELERLGLL